MNLDLDVSRPFFAFRRKNEQGVWLCTGEMSNVREIDDIPIPGDLPPSMPFGSVSAIPFAQARERGFPVHDGSEPIRVLSIENAEFHPLEEFVRALPNVPVTATDVTFDSTSEEYEETIRKIVRDEIGRGLGANFVIARRCTAHLPDFSIDVALSIFRKLLTEESGTYWTFILGTGESIVLGATPERHLSVTGGETKMNPISGTFRKDGTSSLAEQHRFLDFLEDQKEVFELFMVTDEELKIMCEICDRGGAIVGPMLKEMSKLIHTEYLLLGHSDRTVHDLLRRSMYAPTVTGSPVLSAFRTIHRYEQESRSYYGATIALLGRDEDSQITLDAPITIRTMEIDQKGDLVIRVGATLVRDSDPATEVRETEAKIAGILSALQSDEPEHKAPVRLLDAVDPEAIQISLQRRNLYLSRFWFEPQSMSYNAVPQLADVPITIVDAEDGFSSMIGRMVGQMGARVTVVGFAEYGEDDAAVTILGPGPGDPTDDNDPKMQTMREHMERLRKSGRPFFAECLSHQLLCRALGLRVVRKSSPLQGTQRVIELFGTAERVGFYNTFVGLEGPTSSPVEICADPQTHEVHALRGEGFYSVQFHPESILSPQGYEIIKRALVSLVAKTS